MRMTFFSLFFSKNACLLTSSYIQYSTRRRLSFSFDGKASTQLDNTQLESLLEVLELSQKEFFMMKRKQKKKVFLTRLLSDKNMKLFPN